MLVANLVATSSTQVLVVDHWQRAGGDVVRLRAKHCVVPAHSKRPDVGGSGGETGGFREESCGCESELVKENGDMRG
jgi:hypothetical protein